MEPAQGAGNNIGEGGDGPPKEGTRESSSSSFSGSSSSSVTLASRDSRTAVYGNENRDNRRMTDGDIRKTFIVGQTMDGAGDIGSARPDVHERNIRGYNRGRGDDSSNLDPITENVGTNRTRGGKPRRPRTGSGMKGRNAGTSGRGKGIDRERNEEEQEVTAGNVDENEAAGFGGGRRRKSGGSRPARKKVLGSTPKRNFLRVNVRLSVDLPATSADHHSGEQAFRIVKGYTFGQLLLDACNHYHLPLSSSKPNQLQPLSHSNTNPAFSSFASTSHSNLSTQLSLEPMSTWSSPAAAIEFPDQAASHDGEWSAVLMDRTKTAIWPSSGVIANELVEDDVSDESPHLPCVHLVLRPVIKTATARQRVVDKNSSAVGHFVSSQFSKPTVVVSDWETIRAHVERSTSTTSGTMGKSSSAPAEAQFFEYLSKGNKSSLASSRPRKLAQSLDRTTLIAEGQRSSDEDENEETDDHESLVDDSDGSGCHPPGSVEEETCCEEDAASSVNANSHKHMGFRKRIKSAMKKKGGLALESLGKSSSAEDVLTIPDDDNSSSSSNNNDNKSVADSTKRSRTRSATSKFYQNLSKGASKAMHAASLTSSASCDSVVTLASDGPSASAKHDVDEPGAYSTSTSSQPTSPVRNSQTKTVSHSSSSSKPEPVRSSSVASFFESRGSRQPDVIEPAVTVGGGSGIGRLPNSDPEATQRQQEKVATIPVSKSSEAVTKGMKKESPRKGSNADERKEKEKEKEKDNRAKEKDGEKGNGKGEILEDGESTEKDGEEKGKGILRMLKSSSHKKKGKDKEKEKEKDKDKEREKERDKENEKQPKGILKSGKHARFQSSGSVSPVPSKSTTLPTTNNSAFTNIGTGSSSIGSSSSGSGIYIPKMERGGGGGGEVTHEDHGSGSSSSGRWGDDSARELLGDGLETRPTPVHALPRLKGKEKRWPHKSGIRLIKFSSQRALSLSVTNGEIASPKNLTKATKLLWDDKPKVALIIKKHRDPRITQQLVQVVAYLTEVHKLVVLVEEPVKSEVPEFTSWNEYLTKERDNGKDLQLAQAVDFIVSLGGDGTLLHINSLFPSALPPIIAFSLGSLGFLTPFDFQDHKEELDTVMSGDFFITVRQRLECTIYKLASDGSKYHPMPAYHCMNEIVVDRGPDSHLCSLEVYCDDLLITTIQADGVIIFSATGSTAYSLSAGGPMVHPVVAGIGLTPICPHSLSCRPIMFPDSVTIKIKVPVGARIPGWVSCDGRDRTELKEKEYVILKSSQWPVPCINKTDQIGDWFKSLSEGLNWNFRTAQKPHTF